MSYGTKYILKQSTLLNEYYEISFDFLDWAGAVTQIEGTKKFLNLRSVTGDENRLEPILGTEAIIQIYVKETDSITIADLIAQHDSDIRVTVSLIDQATGATTIPFQGFVVVEDNNQPFLDKPFILTVRALDGLGLLKGVDLVDTDGFLFTGSQTIMQWIGQILYKTNQDIPVRVYFNFFPKNFSELSALSEVTLNAVTFSQGDAFNVSPTDPSIDIFQSAADDCYTALEKIMRCLRCRLFFEDGRFMIVNLQEYANENYQYNEYTFGTPVGGIVPMNPSDAGVKKYNTPISKNDIIFPAEKDQILYLKLATKWIKLTYNYDQSLNKVCNQDFSEGNADSSNDGTISSTIVDPTISPVVTLDYKAFLIYCWTHLNGGGTLGNANAYPSSAPDKKAYIRQVNDSLGYPILRSVIMESTSSNNTVTYIRSNRFLIDVNDVLQLTFSFRTENLGTAGIYLVAWAYLYGDDGSFWSMRCTDNGTIPGNPTVWVSVDSNFQGGSGGSPAIGNTVDPSNGWTSVQANQNSNSGYAKTPVSGTIEILLVGNVGSFADPGEFWVKDLNVQILPYLQGTYQQLKGDYNFSGSNNNIKQTDSETVEISDSPKRYFKGALLAPDGATLIPADWHRRGVTESFRFTQAMERTMYNLLGRMVYKIEGNFKGLQYRDNDDYSSLHPAGYLNSYFFIDGDFPTKKFILTSFDIDVYQGQGRRVFVEVLNDDNDSGWNPPDNYKFDYIFQ